MRKHTCLAKTTEGRAAKLVSKSMDVNPNAKPAAIQGNAILTEMQNRKPWNEVSSIVKKVTNKRAIANEKAKQKRQILPKGVNFNAVSEYKKYTDEKDSFLLVLFGVLLLARYCLTAYMLPDSNTTTSTRAPTAY